MVDIKLSGKLTDITTHPVETITQFSVKAATWTPTGAGLTTTQPAAVDVDESGEFTITAQAGVKAWLYLDGDGWSDTIPFIAAEGMDAIWEAIVNAMNFPSTMGEYLAIKDKFKSTADAVIAELIKKYPFDKWYQGPAVDGIDADLLREQKHNGAYAQLKLGQIANTPKERGTLQVTYIAGNNTSIAQQVFYAETGTVYTRMFDNYKGSGWSEWVANKPLGFAQTTTRGTDANTLTDPTQSGIYPKHLPDWITNTPDENGTLLVHYLAGNNSAVVQQVFFGLSGAVYTRLYDTNTGTGWGAWKIHSGSGGVAPSASSTIAYEDMLRTKGRIGTNGKPVVCLRFDHNLAPFDQKVKPILKRLGLPATMACFVNMMSPQPGYTNDVSSGKTWADVEANFHDGIEVFSQSFSHQDADTPEAIRREVVDSRRALETAMPQLKVFGWTQPGTANGYDGWWDKEARIASTYNDNVAGQLVASTYGCFNIHEDGGYFAQGSRFQNFDGIDKKTSAAYVDSMIDRLIAVGGVYTIMLHSHRLDEPGWITSQVLEEMLEIIARRRDAGEIEVLTMSGAALADPGSAWRASLTPPIEKWARNGDELSTTVRMDSASYAGGAVRQLRVRASVGGTVTMRVRDTGDSGLDTSRSVSVSGPADLVMPVGVPVAASSLEVSVTAVDCEVKYAALESV